MTQQQTGVTLYVIQTGAFEGGDVSGYLLMAPDGEVIHSHMSSSMSWLVSDLTQNFGRADELASTYPDHKVVVVKGEDPIPAEIAHHFTEVTA